MTEIALYAIYDRVMKMSGRPLMNDLTGERYGRLLVVGRTERRDRVEWSCQCDCGRGCKVQSFDLISGKVRSCGCYHKERQKEIMTLKHDVQRNRIFIIKPT